MYTHVTLSINTPQWEIDFVCVVCTSCGVLYRGYQFWSSCCSGLAGISGIWPSTGVPCRGGGVARRSWEEFGAFHRQPVGEARRKEEL